MVEWRDGEPVSEHLTLPMVEHTAEQLIHIIKESVTNFGNLPVFAKCKPRGASTDFMTKYSNYCGFLENQLNQFLKSAAIRRENGPKGAELIEIDSTPFHLLELVLTRIYQAAHEQLRLKTEWDLVLDVIRSLQPFLMVLNHIDADNKILKSNRYAYLETIENEIYEFHLGAYKYQLKERLRDVKSQSRKLCKYIKDDVEKVETIRRMEEASVARFTDEIFYYLSPVSYEKLLRIFESRKQKASKSTASTTSGQSEDSKITVQPTISAQIPSEPKEDVPEERSLEDVPENNSEDALEQNPAEDVLGKNPEENPEDVLGKNAAEDVSLEKNSEDVPGENPQSSASQHLQEAMEVDEPQNTGSTESAQPSRPQVIVAMEINEPETLDRSPTPSATEESSIQRQHHQNVSQGGEDRPRESQGSSGSVRPRQAPPQHPETVPEPSRESQGSLESVRPPPEPSDHPELVSEPSRESPELTRFVRHFRAPPEVPEPPRESQGSSESARPRQAPPQHPEVVPEPPRESQGSSGPVRPPDVPPYREDRLSEPYVPPRPSPEDPDSLSGSPESVSTLSETSIEPDAISFEDFRSSDLSPIRRDYPQPEPPRPSVRPTIGGAQRQVPELRRDQDQEEREVNDILAFAFGNRQPAPPEVPIRNRQDDVQPGRDQERARRGSPILSMNIIGGPRGLPEVPIRNRQDPPRGTRVPKIPTQTDLNLEAYPPSNKAKYLNEKGEYEDQPFVNRYHPDRGLEVPGPKVNVVWSYGGVPIEPENSPARPEEAPATAPPIQIDEIAGNEEDRVADVEDSDRHGEEDVGEDARENEESEAALHEPSPGRDEPTSSSSGGLGGVGEAQPESSDSRLKRDRSEDPDGGDGAGPSQKIPRIG